jgi:hypothetical protein
MVHKLCTQMCGRHLEHAENTDFVLTDWYGCINLLWWWEGGFSTKLISSTDGRWEVLGLWAKNRGGTGMFPKPTFAVDLQAVQWYTYKRSCLTTPSSLTEGHISPLPGVPSCESYQQSLHWLKLCAVSYSMLPSPYNCEREGGKIVLQLIGHDHHH